MNSLFLSASIKLFLIQPHIFPCGYNSKTSNMIILLKRIKLESYLHDGICSIAYIKECEIFEDL